MTQIEDKARAEELQQQAVDDFSAQALKLIESYDKIAEAAIQVQDFEGAITAQQQSGAVSLTTYNVLSHRAHKLLGGAESSNRDESEELGDDLD